MGVPSIGGVGAQCMGLGATQVVQSTGTSAQSAVPNAGVRIWRLCSDADCYCLFGTNPTATAATGFLLPAGVVEYVDVSSGPKLAVISKSGTSNLSITDCT